MTTSSLTLTYSWTRTLRKPTAWRMERASSGVQTPWSPSSRTASPLSAGGPQPSAAQMCWATSTHASIAVMNVQDPVLVDHGLPVPSRDGRGELPVGAGDPRQLVEVDLPGHRLPADPRDPVVFKQAPSAGR